MAAKEQDGAFIAHLFGQGHKVLPHPLRVSSSRQPKESSIRGTVYQLHRIDRWRPSGPPRRILRPSFPGSSLLTCPSCLWRKISIVDISNFNVSSFLDELWIHFFFRIIIFTCLGLREDLIGPERVLFNIEGLLDLINSMIPDLWNMTPWRVKFLTRLLPTFFHMLSPCLFWMYSAMFCRISPYILGLGLVSGPRFLPDGSAPKFFLAWYLDQIYLVLGS